MLADILEQKGVIGSSERARVRSVGNEDGVRILAVILKERGLLNTDELARISLAPAAVPSIPATYDAAAQAPPVPQQRRASEPIPLLAKIPIHVYGTILLNSFSNASLTNNQDIASFAGKQGSDVTGGDKNFGMTSRQSRFGIKYTGPQVDGGRLSGTVEFDFNAGSATVANGADYFIPRMRLAFGRLDWQNFSLEAGQDWAIFAPLNPTSLSSYAVAPLNASGNLWVREPQLRAEFQRSFSDTSKIVYQIAATDPNEGDNPSTFNSTRVPGIGERGRIPAFESRVAYTDSAMTFGLSGHYGRGKNAGPIGTRNVQTGVDSWGVAGDWSVPVGKMLIFTGKAYEGRALGAYAGSLGQSVLPVGTVGEHGVETRGGWTQAQVNFTRQWQTNLVYGIDLPNPHQLTAGLRDKSQTYFGM